MKFFMKICLAVIIVSLMAVQFKTSIHANSQSSWKQVWTGYDTSVYDIVYGNGIYLAIGDNGTILSSVDCKNWKEQNSNVKDTLHSICFSQNMFVAVGNKGTIITSSDGANWSNYLEPSGQNLLSVTYGNNLFVAVGARGIILVSSDGKIWEQKSAPSQVLFKSVAFLNKKFVAIGVSNEFSYKAGAIYNSEDGINWVNTLFPEYINTEINNVISDGKNFYIVSPGDGNNGKIKQSSDGISWNTVYDKGVKLKNISLFKENLMVFSEDSDKNLLSKDGENWLTYTDNTFIDCSNIFEWEKNILAVGNNKILLFENTLDLLNKNSINGEIKVILNNKLISFDVPPQIIEGRTLVPMRKVFELMGANVAWYNNTKTVLITMKNIIISLKINSKEIVINNEVKAMDVPAKIIDGRTLVPLRFISEALGCSVSWDAPTKTVTINK